MRKVTHKPFVLFLSVLGLAMVLCSCTESKKTEDTALKINNYTLSSAKFEEMFKELEPQDTPEKRAYFLNNLIMRKLLLQEAQKRELDTQKEFLKDIENFWEKSLLKIVVDQKSKEVSSQVVVSEQEIQGAYEVWVKETPENRKPLPEVHDLILWRLRKEKESKLMEQWILELKQQSSIRVDKKALRLE